MEQVYRTHYVSECTKELTGKMIVLNGWVQKRRDLGGLIFIDLRDRTGLVQVVFNPEISAEAAAVADQIRSEYVLAVRGEVVKRDPENVNPNMETGEIEVLAKEVHVFNAAKTPPFMIADDEEVDESIRLKYRYLDLRRPGMQTTMQIRHKAMQVVRRFLDRHHFMELETPMLTRSTPEGARDYLVPSRLHEGEFYALPQSPQLFKQLFMVAGMDRYFQFARCFRDEDLRADRQPEFTQIDIEASFLPAEELQSMMEQMMAELFQETIGVKVETPFPRLTYLEAMERYGSDKPDLRFGMELNDLSEALKKTSFQVFAKTIQNGGQVKAICAKGCAGWSRKIIDGWSTKAQELGAKGLAWLAFKESGVKGSVVKFLTEEEIARIQEITGAGTGDLLFFVADRPSVVAHVLGQLRLLLGQELGLIDPDVYRFAWIVDFPLLEYSEEDGRYYAMHHPFTMPVEEDIDLLETEPGKVRAKAYDMVLNGYEIGGGSQRIYQREIQEKMFKALGITEEESKEKFGFLLRAFEYGAPPHGGIAFGFDRIVMLLAKRSNLRECIAFPKTAQASCLLTEAPSPVEESQLDELHIQIKPKKKAEDVLA
ncbi:aspartate--tRNA ligase [Thermoactinomyces vulgaris]|uniref:Aspartate--tRNA ligase n=1 Tax=Thermoactinomyces vulgaris TaxID=2026 RepID=A0ABS0QHJ7_THEVU|nr:aspartate--tRNA ligase [Thermoactinomyces vulgaris]MBA4550746.1 aspartate--tRNA ligase [Thermoactinomyces vulgaris]MBA4596195.1 aspartate--tRNA ligase [Thermoactinomyces vulgaris]MBH8588522.1 aspartate--tRNA ligase [Thermoactinomyces vulgaris]RMB02229.1 aspartyl-tRNA synthetase [Thermoactinomyces vulgaris]